MSPDSFVPFRLIHDTRHTQYAGRTVTYSTARGSGLRSLINSAFMHLSRRAETIDPAILQETFVDVGALFALLSSPDDQVIYGRRGTGKTHALKYLHQDRFQNNDPVVYLDLRTIGSTGGLYADETLPIEERATRLLSDTLSEIHNELLSFVLGDKAEHDLSQIGPILDDLVEDISNVRVVGDTEYETTNSESTANEAMPQTDEL